MSSWLILILLGYRFSLASPTQSKCACKYKLQAVCTRDPATVSVPCPTMAGEELTFTLRKDEREIHIQKCNNTANTLDCESSANADLVLREVNTSVSFVLTGELAKNGGLYSCEGMVRFPPPFKTEMSAVRILVHVEGKQRSQMQQWRNQSGQWTPLDLDPCAWSFMHLQHRRNHYRGGQLGQCEAVKFPE
ncbi:uncharacterized protein LOC144014909 isoform X2 [Festucalex cinctus]